MSFKNIIDDSSTTIDHLIKLAVFERAGDNLIYIKKFSRNGALVANVEEDV